MKASVVTNRTAEREYEIKLNEPFKYKNAQVPIKHLKINTIIVNALQKLKKCMVK